VGPRASLDVCKKSHEICFCLLAKCLSLILLTLICLFLCLIASLRIDILTYVSVSAVRVAMRGGCAESEVLHTDISATVQCLSFECGTINCTLISVPQFSACLTTPHTHTHTHTIKDTLSPLTCMWRIDRGSVHMLPVPTAAMLDLSAPSLLVPYVAGALYSTSWQP
jgi:hypothetical protein